MSVVDLDLGNLEDAVSAADEALALAPPHASRAVIATLVTAAVVPKVIDQLAPVLAEHAATAERMRATNVQVRDEIQAIGESARAQSRRIQRVFEEIDPDAVAAQIVGTYELGGNTLDERDIMFTRMTVRHALTAVTHALGLSLEVDETNFQDL